MKRAAWLPFMAIAAMNVAPSFADEVETRIGKIPLQFGLPADEATRQKLYDELDFQRATQLYIWDLPIVSFAQWQYAARYSQLDECSDYFYEAVTTTCGMVSKVPGAGQAYLGAYRDKSGNWFDGGKNYKLHVPADTPAKLFWSLTIYDALTRVLINNGHGVADRSSRTDMTKNADGSFDIYMGPTAPKGFEKNWIATNKGKAWFAYFRLYGPEEPYFDRRWKLPDIETIE